MAAIAAPAISPVAIPYIFLLTSDDRSLQALFELFMAHITHNTNTHTYTHTYFCDLSFFCVVFGHQKPKKNKKHKKKK